MLEMVSNHGNWNVNLKLTFCVLSPLSLNFEYSIEQIKKKRKPNQADVANNIITNVSPAFKPGNRK